MVKRKRLLIPALLLLFSLISPALAGAAQLTQAAVRLDRLGATDAAGILVTFKLGSNTGVTKVVVSFPTGFNITAGTPAVTTSPFPLTPAGIVAAPGIGSTVTAASSGSNLGGTITATLSAPSTGVLYGFMVSSGTVTNPTTGGQQYSLTVATQTAASAIVESSTTPSYITSSSTGDQVTVTASVAPTFSFSLSSNADSILGIDDTASKTSTGVTMTVGTNAALGYTAYVRSSGSLTSATSGGSIPTGTFNGAADSLAPGTTSKYGFVPTSGTICNPSCGGSVTYDTEYSGQTAGNVTPGTAGAFNGSSFASFVSRNGYTVSDAILLQERVAVTKAIAPATDYSDTLTIVAAGNF